MSDANEKPGDRRRSMRLRINTPVTIEHDGKVYETHGSDISDKGMLVLTEDLPPIGTVVKLSCVDESGKQIEVEAKVSRHHSGADGQTGFVVTEGEE